MTPADVHQPRHAAPSGPAPVESAPRPIGIPAQRVPEHADAPSPNGAAPAASPTGGTHHSLTPPAGLSVGEGPIERRPRPWAAFAFFGIVLIALGVITVVGLTTSTPTSGSGQSTPAPAPAAPVLTPQEQLALWNSGGGSSRLQAVTADLNAVGNAGGRLDPSAMNTACRSLQQDIESAQAYGPLPDYQAQAAWSSALAHGARSATYCIAGTDAMSSSLIDSATSEINQMTDDLNRAADRIGVINGTG